MRQYVDKEKLYQYMDNEVEWIENKDRLLALEVVSEFEEENVAPVPRGKWVGKPIAGYCNIRCSKCGEIYYSKGKWNYCPQCGAKMDLE